MQDINSKLVSILDASLAKSISLGITPSDSTSSNTFNPLDAYLQQNNPTQQYLEQSQGEAVDLSRNATTLEYFNAASGNLVSTIADTPKNLIDNPTGLVDALKGARQYGIDKVQNPYYDWVGRERVNPQEDPLMQTLDAAKQGINTTGDAWSKAQQESPFLKEVADTGKDLAQYLSYLGQGVKDLVVPAENVKFAETEAVAKDVASYREQGDDIVTAWIKATVSNPEAILPSVAQKVPTVAAMVLAPYSVGLAMGIEEINKAKEELTLNFIKIQGRAPTEEEYNSSAFLAGAGVVSDLFVDRLLATGAITKAAKDAIKNKNVGKSLALGLGVVGAGAGEAVTEGGATLLKDSAATLEAPTEESIQDAVTGAVMGSLGAGGIQTAASIPEAVGMSVDTVKTAREQSAKLKSENAAVQVDAMVNDADLAKYVSTEVPEAAKYTRDVTNEDGTVTQEVYNPLQELKDATDKFDSIYVEKLVEQVAAQEAAKQATASETTEGVPTEEVVVDDATKAATERSEEVKQLAKWNAFVSATNTLIDKTEEAVQFVEEVKANNPSMSKKEVAILTSVGLNAQKLIDTNRNIKEEEALAIADLVARRYVEDNASVPEPSVKAVVSALAKELDIKLKDDNVNPVEMVKDSINALSLTSTKEELEELKTTVDTLQQVKYTKATKPNEQSSLGATASDAFGNQVKNSNDVLHEIVYGSRLGLKRGSKIVDDTTDQKGLVDSMAELAIIKSNPASNEGLFNKSLKGLTEHLQTQQNKIDNWSWGKGVTRETAKERARNAYDNIQKSIELIKRVQDHYVKAGLEAYPENRQVLALQSGLTPSKPKAEAKPTAKQASPTKPSKPTRNKITSMSEVDAELPNITPSKEDMGVIEVAGFTPVMNTDTTSQVLNTKLKTSTTEVVDGKPVTTATPSTTLDYVTASKNPKTGQLLTVTTEDVVYDGMPVAIRINSNSDQLTNSSTNLADAVNSINGAKQAPIEQSVGKFLQDFIRVQTIRVIQVLGKRTARELLLSYMGKDTVNKDGLDFVQRILFTGNQLNKSVATLSSVVSAHWLITNGLSIPTRTTEDTLRLLGGVNNSAVDANTLQVIHSEMRQYGVPRVGVANTLGKAIYNQLNLETVSENVPYRFKEQLQAALGGIALANLEAQGIIKVSQVPSTKYNEWLAAISSVTPEKVRSEEATVAFVTINTDVTTYKPADNVLEFLGDIKTNSKEIFAAFDIVNDRPGISNTPYSEVKVDNKKGLELPEEHVKRISELNKIAHRFNTDLLQAFTSTRGLNFVLNTMAGTLGTGKEINLIKFDGKFGIEIDMYKIEEWTIANFQVTNQVSARESLVGWVMSIDSVLQVLQQTGKYTTMEEAVADLQANPKDFYMKHAVFLQGRFGPSSADINPQTDKLHRLLFKPAKQEVATTTKDAASVEYQIGLGFQLGLIDEKSTEASAAATIDSMNEAIQELVADDAVVELLQNVTNGKVLDSKSLKALFETMKIRGLADSLGFGSTLTFKDVTSLIELSNAALALNGYKSHFTSHIVIEVDGVTNGFALGILQSPVLNDIVTHLKRVGVYQQGSSIATYGAFKQSKANDSYQNLSTVAGTFMKASGLKQEQLTNMVNLLSVKEGDSLITLGEKVSKSSRDFFKYPFMVFVYGASMGAIQHLILRQINGVINTKIEAINAIKDPDAQSIALGKLNQELMQAGITTRPVSIQQLMSTDLSSRVSSSKQVQKVQQSIAKAIEQELAPLIEVKELVNSVFNAQFNVFQSAYKQALSKLPENPTEQQIKDLMALLEPLIPSYTGMTGKKGTNQRFPAFKLVKAAGNRKAIIDLQFSLDGSKTFSVNTNLKDLESAGVSGYVLMVHSIDAYIMGYESEVYNDTALRVHDAIKVSWKHMTELTKVLNQRTADSIVNFSLMQDVLDNLASILEASYKLKSNEKGQLTDGFMLIDEIFANPRSESPIGEPLEFLYKLGKYIEDYKAGYELLDSTGLIVNQYAAPAEIGTATIAKGELKNKRIVVPSTLQYLLNLVQTLTPAQINETLEAIHEIANRKDNSKSFPKLVSKIRAITTEIINC